MRNNLRDRLLMLPGNIEKVFIVLAMLAVSGIMLTVAILRYTSIRFLSYEELVLIIAFWLYMFGAAFSAREGTEVKADVISLIVKKKGALRIINVIEAILTTFLNGVFLKWSWDYYQISILLNARTSILHIPQHVMYLSIFVGMALMFIHHCVRLFKTIKALKNQEPEEAVE